MSPYYVEYKNAHVIHVFHSLDVFRHICLLSSYFIIRKLKVEQFRTHSWKPMVYYDKGDDDNSINAIFMMPLSCHKAKIYFRKNYVIGWSLTEGLHLQ